MSKRTSKKDGNGTGGGAACDAMALAAEALARGWHPVALDPSTKKPQGVKWQLRTITRENLSQYFSGNVGVGLQMGPKSNGLTDIDLDCAEAVVLAPSFLPKTDAVYGRASKRRSHCLYVTPDPEPKAWVRWMDDEKKVMLELRMGGGGKGAQSVMPGSVHTSGETYEWDARGEPAKSDCATLKAACVRLAAASLLMRHWPLKGALHDTALAVGGFLARAGWSASAVEHFVLAICSNLRGVQEPKKHAKTARDSVESHAKGAHVYGLPQLCEFFGEEVAKTAAHIIGYHSNVEVSEAKTVEVGEAGIGLSDFYAYMPTHNFIFAPTRELWPAESVNARIPPIQVGVDDDGKPVKISAARWLDQNRAVVQMTWAPGLPMIIRGRMMSLGGWIERGDVACFNLYRPPTIELGDADEAQPWVDLVHKIYPAEADHIIKYCAQRVQQPQVKVNHALVLGSLAQGIGKDTFLEGLRRAVGPWNFYEIAPKHIFDPFNPWRRSVVLRVSEAKDMGDVSRFELYESIKTLTTTPPEVIDCNEKHIKQHYVLNVMGIVITTNHLTDGIHLPPEDRRHFVAWSDCTPADFEEGYWNKYWKWFDGGGDQHIAAYLATLDISDFDPKEPPPKTPAFWSIVNANRTTEEAELQDVIDGLGSPDALTIEAIKDKADFSLREWMRERRNRKAVAHRLETCGYRAVNNATANDGLWRIDDHRQVVYAKASLPLREQVKAAEKLQRDAAKAAAEAAAKVAAEAAERWNRREKASSQKTPPPQRKLTYR